MSLLDFENWDSYTPPAMGAWTQTGVYVSETANFHSSPNAVKTTANTGPNSSIAYLALTDSNGGDSRATLVCGIASAVSGTALCYVYNRMATAGTSTGSTVGYRAYIDFVLGRAGIDAISLGTGLLLGHVTCSDLLLHPEEYNLLLECIGFHIVARCQRISDSYWLNSAGVFQASQTYFLSATDLTAGGIGNHGFSIASSSSANTIYIDDLTWETYPPVDTVSEGAPGGRSVLAIYQASESAPGTDAITGIYLVSDAAPGVDSVMVIGLSIYVINEGPPGADSAIGIYIVVEGQPGREDLAIITAILEGAPGSDSVSKAVIVEDVPPTDPVVPLAGGTIRVVEGAPGMEQIIQALRTVRLTEPTAPGGSVAFFGAPGTIVIEEFPPGVDSVAVQDVTPCGSLCPEDVVLQLGSFVFDFDGTPIIGYSGGESVFLGGTTFLTVCSPYASPFYQNGSVTHAFSFTWPAYEIDSISIKARHVVQKGYVSCSFYGVEDTTTGEEDLEIPVSFLSGQHVAGQTVSLIVTVSSFTGQVRPNGHAFVPPRPNIAPVTPAPFIANCSSFSNQIQATLHTHAVGNNFDISDRISTFSTSHVYTADGNAFAFTDNWECVSIVIRPKCLKPQIAIGTGQTADVCTSVESRVVGGESNLPQWVRDGNKGWVILDNHGTVVNSSATPDGFPKFSLDACGQGTIEVDCCPFPIDSTHNLGDLFPTAFTWPWRVEYLTFVGDRGNGMEYDVRTCSPFVQVIEETCPNTGPPPPPPPPPYDRATRVCMLRDYTHRLMLFYLDLDNRVIVSLFDDNDSNPEMVTVDDYKGCLAPRFYREGVYVGGTYLRGTSPKFARSKTHGKDWKVTDIPGGYQSCTSTVHRGGRIVFLGYKDRVEGPPPVAAQWYCRVGVPHDDGTFTWSSEVKLNFSGPSGAGHLTNRNDGVMEFAWTDTGNVRHIARARGVSNSGGASTDWV